MYLYSYNDNTLILWFTSLEFTPRVYYEDSLLLLDDGTLDVLLGCGLLCMVMDGALDRGLVYGLLCMI